MSDVLSDRRAWDLCDRCGKHGRLLVQVEIDGEHYDRESAEACSHPMIREAERAVVAALAARSGVDVESLLAECLERDFNGAWALDAIRLALATAEARHGHSTPTNREIAAECRALDLQRQLDEANGLARVVEARHAERERRWLELYRLARTNYDGDREDTIAELLGVPVETREQARRVLGLEG